MTEDDANIALAKRGYELYNAADWDALRQLLAPDVVVESLAGLPPLHGPDEVIANQAPDAFEWQRAEPIAYEAAGDKVLVRIRARAKGAGSALELDALGWQVLTIRDGRLAHMFTTLDEAEARAVFAG